MFRGGVVERERYAGRRIFGAGLNLTRLYLGLIPYRFFIDRDMGYVNKLYRGLSAPSTGPASPSRRSRSRGSPALRRTRSAAPASSCMSWTT